jgi:hypothetical protein
LTDNRRNGHGEDTVVSVEMGKEDWLKILIDDDLGKMKSFATGLNIHI